jgi:hypothetical protein
MTIAILGRTCDSTGSSQLMSALLVNRCAAPAHASIALTLSINATDSVATAATGRESHATMFAFTLAADHDPTKRIAPCSSSTGFPWTGPLPPVRSNINVPAGSLSIELQLPGHAVAVLRMGEYAPDGSARHPNQRTWKAGV